MGFIYPPLYLNSQPSFPASVYVSPALLRPVVCLVIVVAPEIEQVITSLVSDFSIDALKLFMCDSKILAALFKEGVTILWLCAWVVFSTIIKPMYEIGASREGNQF
jgi:hypothetical protein